MSKKVQAQVGWVERERERERERQRGVGSRGRQSVWQATYKVTNIDSFAEIKSRQSY